MLSPTYWVGVLISCAIPEASCPMERSFCDCASCFSMSLRSVMSAPMMVTPRPSTSSPASRLMVSPSTPSVPLRRRKATSSIRTDSPSARQCSSPWRTRSQSHPISTSASGRPQIASGGRPKTLVAMRFQRRTRKSAESPMRMVGQAGQQRLGLAQQAAGLRAAGAAANLDHRRLNGRRGSVGSPGIGAGRRQRSAHRRRSTQMPLLRRISSACWRSKASPPPRLTSAMACRTSSLTPACFIAIRSAGELNVRGFIALP